MIVYRIFLWVHVISAACWILAFLTSLFYAFKVSGAAKTGEEKKFMQSERKATSIGAHVGSVGILISGPILSSISGGPQWGWFPFHQFTWLAIKQIVFIVILILVAFSVKKSLSFKKQIRGEGSDMVSKQARKKWKSAYLISLAVYILVVFNAYLGSAKPF